MCTKFDLVVSLLLIKRACIQNYPIFRITPTYLIHALIMRPDCDLAFVLVIARAMRKTFRDDWCT